MSTDPDQPSLPAAPPPPEPDGPQAAPTVQAPAVKAPAAPPPDAAQPPPRWGQEPPTQAVPAWQPPPPPPPAPQRAQPQPPQPQPQFRPAQPQQRPPEQWQQPRPWTEPQPWVEPQNDQPGQRPARQSPASQQPRARRRRRKLRARRSVMALFTVIVLLILLVIGDRVALAITENDMASQFTQNGFPVKPSVSIRGFPFLTQLAAKDFRTVNISASNVPAGPVSITSIHATIDGMHFTSFSSSASARIDRLNATAFVSFGALTAAGGIAGGSQVTVTPVGPNTVKISADLGGVLSDSEEAQITTTGPQTISVKVLPSGGPLGSLLSSFGSFSFSLPKGVPSSLRITRLDLNSQGLTVSASATDATFGK